MKKPKRRQKQLLVDAEKRVYELRKEIELLRATICLLTYKINNEKKHDNII